MDCGHNESGCIVGGRVASAASSKDAAMKGHRVKGEGFVVATALMAAAFTAFDVATKAATSKVALI